MANYEAVARSNYFKIKNFEAFHQWCEEMKISYIGPTDDGMFMVSPTDPDSGWPTLECGDVFTELGAFHLQEGEVAVFLEIGYEKLRYLIGYAVAVNHLGEYVSVDLNDIYSKAKDHFGVSPTLAEY